jgi:hypothetical protein
MLIGDKYKVESDTLNVTLYYKQKPRKSSEVERWRPFAYFSSPKCALKHLINLEVMETGLTDLKSVVEKIDELYRLVDTLKGLPELQRPA